MGVRGIDLTEDHKPENPKERKRIERMGGTVEDSGEDGLSSSVWLPDASAGLAMSRSFGDTEFHRVGVTTEPTVTSYEIGDYDEFLIFRRCSDDTITIYGRISLDSTPLGDYDEFLILASDGIWEMLTSDQAARIVQGHGKACVELTITIYGRI